MQQPTESENRVTTSVKVFISYAHADYEMHEKLQQHLSPLRNAEKITIWQDQEIPAGANWEDQIETQLNEAEMILLLVSPSFIDSKYCWNKEVQIALERHKAGTARVIPVILRHVAWKQTPLGQIQALPIGGKPVAEWGDHDKAFLNVVEGIEKVVDLLNKARKVQTEQLLLDTSSLPSLKEQTEPLQRRPLLVSPKARLLFLIGLIFLLIVLIVGSLALGIRAYGNSQQTSHINATATTVASTYPFSSTLSLNDALTHNNASLSYAWANHRDPNGDDCFFSDNVYHATQDTIGGYHTCAAEKTSYSNFTFEVEMTIIKGNNGDYGGLMFRGASQSAQFYQLTIDSQGNYDLAISLDTQSANVELAHGSAFPSFTPGLNQHNIISVVVVGNNISLYVNKHRIKNVEDRHNYYSSGEVGFIAGSNSGATEVTYTNARVWELPA